MCRSNVSDRIGVVLLQMLNKKGLSAAEYHGFRVVTGRVFLPTITAFEPIAVPHVHFRYLPWIKHPRPSDL
jgi:hypothetical protein